MWIGVGLGALVFAWLTRGAWSLNPIGAGDAMFHLVRADEGIELLTQGRINGWSPRYYLGSDLFLFYGPGLVWFMALIRVASFGLLDNAAALTVAVLSSLLLVPAAVAFLARSLGLSFRVAGIAAILSPLVSTVWGVGMDGVFQHGLLTHQLGTVLWLLGLGCLVRAYRDRHPKWIVATGALGAYLAITSPIVLAMLAVVGLAAVAGVHISERPGWSGPRRLALTGLATAGLAGFWLIPALAHRDLRGGSTWWGGYEPLELLGFIFFGNAVLPPGFALAAIVAALFMVRKGHQAGWLLLVAPVVYLSVEVWATTRPPDNMVIAQFQNHRGLGLIGLVLVIPFAWALDGVGGRFRAWRSTRVQMGAGVLLAVLVALVMSPTASMARSHPDPIAQMHEAVEVLATVVPDGGRWAFVRDWPDELSATETISPHHWLARYSGAPLLNGVGLETTRAHASYRVGEDIGRVPPEQSSRGLIRNGTTHVLTTNPDQAEELAESGLFEVIWQNDPIAILEVLPTANGDPAVGITGGGLDEAERPVATRDHHRYEVETSRTTTLAIAMAWSPHWHATLNGEPVEASPNNDWMITIDVPAGTNTIELDYELDHWETLGLVVTALSVVVCAVWLWMKGRRSPLRIARG